MAYHRPTQLQDAFTALSENDIRVVAGATDVFPSTQDSGLAGPILDITGIQGLTGIRRTDQAWRIGANTTWSQIAQATLPRSFRALQQAARQVGSPQIQNSATIAGNLCNASPAADGVPPLLILDATVEITSQNGHRQLPLADFLTGPRQTALAPGELVTAILIPNQAAQGASAFAKLGARKYLVISICMAAVKIELSAGKISNIALSIGACSPVARRLVALEQVLLGQPVDSTVTWPIDIENHIRTDLAPIADIRSDREYRILAATELCRKTIRQAVRSVQEKGV